MRIVEFNLSALVGSNVPRRVAQVAASATCVPKGQEADQERRSIQMTSFGSRPSEAAAATEAIQRYAKSLLVLNNQDERPK